jgi:hypothetical protein
VTVGGRRKAAVEIAVIGAFPFARADEQDDFTPRADEFACDRNAGGTTADNAYVAIKPRSVRNFPCVFDHASGAER